MVRRFDHIDLRVSSMAQARPFYAALLPALGFTREAGVEGWFQLEVPGETATDFFGLIESANHVPNENRIAFWAADVEEVNRLAALLARIGARNIEGPGFDEGPGYYAVFFEDPCGNRLEICHRTPPAC